MDTNKIISIVFLTSLTILLTWRRPKEVDSEGNIIAYSLGGYLASPIFLGFYIYGMYYLYTYEHFPDLVTLVLNMLLLTLMFAPFISYLVTRKIKISSGKLSSFSLFTGTKSIDLCAIERLEYSNFWASYIVQSGSTKIVLDWGLSGVEEVLTQLQK